MFQVIVAGFIGSISQLRKVGAKAVPVINLSIATDRFYNGENHTVWHKVTIWGKQAEACAKYLDKGCFVTIQCDRYETRLFETKAGEIDGNTEFVASKVVFGGRGRGKSGDDSTEKPTSTKGKKIANSKRSANEVAPSDSDDDIQW